jgi:predicted DCC family thiol-disulfide oxidoreductase YuxK
MLSKQAVLFYDGDCPLCNRVVTFILNHERSPEILFSALNSEATAQWMAKHPECRMDEDTVYFFEGQRLHCRSTAVLKILPYLRCYVQGFRLGWIFPRALRDAVYNFVAKRRKRIVKECRVDQRLAQRLLQP